MTECNAMASIKHDLGTFLGFSTETNSSLGRNLQATEVLSWDPAHDGKARFWPSGDHAAVAIVFTGKCSVTAAELAALDRLLAELGGDSSENFLKIHYAVNAMSIPLLELTPERLASLQLHIYRGSDFHEVRKDAAYDLFERHHPEAFKVWDNCGVEGLWFETDDFLDSGRWSVEEIRLLDEVAVVVAAL